MDHDVPAGYGGARTANLHAVAPHVGGPRRHHNRMGRYDALAVLTKDALEQGFPVCTQPEPFEPLP
ncbi:hypothetical protein GCM10009736_04620 [Actinomadura bangladeshensis]